MTSSKLHNQVAIITGGGRGVGRATAVALAALGARICIASRTAQQLEQVAAELRAAGSEVVTVAADVGRSDGVNRIFDTVLSTFGQADIMINNAGSFPVGPISEFPEDEFDAAVRVDLKAAFLCSQAALTAGEMLARGDGLIVNVGSVSVRRHIPNMAVHCALKAGLLSLSESLRREVAGRGVRVSLVCPATINTELVQSAEARKYVHGEDKWLRPEDVADLIAYIATRPGDVAISEVAMVGV